MQLGNALSLPSQTPLIFKTSDGASDRGRSGDVMRLFEREGLSVSAAILSGANLPHRDTCSPCRGQEGKKKKSLYQ